jgi:hypothetical protein
MAPRTAIDPNELVTGLVFNDTQGNRHVNISLPRRLLANGSVKAKENWLIANGQIPDPSAPPLPDPVAVIVDEVAADRQAAANTAVEQLRQQLDELQGRLSGQPLSIEELTAFKRELTDYMTQAAMAAAQLAVVEGTGSKIRADLVAIATPLNEQAAETARQQAEHEEVQRRVLSDLQAQAAALTTAQTVARSEAARVAREVAGTFYPASSTIAPEDPRTTDARSWCLKHWGIDRDYIQGDSVLLTRESGVIPLIYKGPSLGWIEGAELEPRVITATGPQILDQSVKSTVLVTNQLTGGGSGGGGLEHFVTNRTSGSNFIVLADSSNWAAAGFQDPRSGFIWLELLDPGSATSGTLSCVFDAGLQVGTNELTTFAMTGVLFDAADLRVELDAVRVPAPVIPPSLAAQGVTAAPGAGPATQIKMRAYSPARGNLLIRGGVSWMFDAAGEPRLTTDPTPLADQPLWIWS